MRRPYIAVLPNEHLEPCASSGVAYVRPRSNDWQGSRNAVNLGVDQWDFMPVNYEQIARRAKRLSAKKHWEDVEH